MSEYTYKVDVNKVIRIVEEDKPISATIAKEAIRLLAHENRELRNELDQLRKAGVGNRNSILIYD